MKKYLFVIFLLVFSLFFSGFGISETQLSPWKEVNTIQIESNLLNMGIKSVYGSGKYMVINHWYNPKEQNYALKYIIYVVNLKTGKKIYEKRYIRAHTEKSVPILGKSLTYLRIEGDFLIYILEDLSNSGITLYKVNLKTGEEMQKKFPWGIGYIGLGYDLRKLYLWDAINKKVLLYDPIEDETTSYSVSSQIKYPGILFGENILIYEDKNGMLKWENLNNHKVFTIAEGEENFRTPGPTFRRETAIFPILIHNKEKGWVINIYNHSGEIIKTYRLSALQISGITTSSQFSQIGNYKNFSAYALLRKGNVPNIYLFFDNHGKLLRMIKKKPEYEGYPKVFETKDGKMCAIFRKSSNSWVVFSEDKEYTLTGYKVSEERLSLIDNNLLIAGKMHNIIKFSLDTKKVTGLYIFPTNKYIAFSHIYNGNTYVVLYDASLPYINSKNYIKIISFPISSPGWLFSGIKKFYPTAYDPYKLYEDTDTDVKLNFPATPYISYEAWGGIKVSVDKGNIKGEYPDYIWHTPHMETPGEEDASITLSLGPIRKTYAVKIVRPDNPIKLEYSEIEKGEDTSSCCGGKLCYFIKVPLKNHANIKIKDLKWHIETADLKDTDIYTFSQIDADEENYITIYGRLYPEVERVKWNGYKIYPKATLKLDYKWGHIEETIKGEVYIEPKYSFYIQVVDQDKNSVKLQKEKIKVFSEDGKDITKKLNITIKDLYTAKVQGISPGFEGKPLKLNIVYNGKSNHIELAFKGKCDTYPFNLTLSPRFILNTVVQRPKEKPQEKPITTLKINVKTNGKPITGFSIEVKKDKKTYKETEIKGLEEGTWTIKIWKKGYIPVEKEVVVKKDKINIVDIELKKFIGFILELNSYYKSAFKDVKEIGIIDSPGLTSLTEYIYILPEGYDRVYFDMIYKVGRPDTIAASIFGEDKYSVSCDIVTNNHKHVVNWSKTQGKKIKTFNMEDLYKKPHEIKSFRILKPTLFKVELKAKAKHTKKKTFGIWVFPSKWNEYKTQVKQGIIIYSLKGNEKLFSFGNNAKIYLKRKAQDELTTSAFNSIVWYGMESISFLKGALGIPDFEIKDITGTVVQMYTDYVLEKELTNLLTTEKIKDIQPLMRDILITGVTGEIYGALTTIVSAGEWAKGISSIISEGVAKVIANQMLYELSQRDNFLCIINTINMLKSHVKNIIHGVDYNDPEEVKEEINEISGCLIGSETGSNCISNCNEYSLIQIFALELSQIREWKSGSSWVPIPEGYISYSIEDKYRASKIAMKIYEPIIKTLFYLVSPVIDACIIGKEGDLKQ